MFCLRFIAGKIVKDFYAYFDFLSNYLLDFYLIVILNCDNSNICDTEVMLILITIMFDK